MKKRMFPLALALILALSGCASKTETTELEEFDIILDWYPNAVHAFIYQAIEQGYPLDPDVEAQSLEILLPMMETEELEFLGQDVTVWQETMDWMYEKCMIDSLMDASEIVVNLDY